MNSTPDNDWDNSRPDSSQNDNLPSLETQEQLNSANLSQRVEEKSESETKSESIDGNHLPEQSPQSEEGLSDFLARHLPDTDEDKQMIGSDKPNTKNLLGDNPPGSEQAAFDSGNLGDASADQFRYNSENLVEDFRENIDKTEQQVNLDKKLKDNSVD